MAIYAISTHHAAKVAHRVKDFGSFIWAKDQPVRYLCGRYSFLSRAMIATEPDAQACRECERRFEDARSGRHADGAR